MRNKNILAQVIYRAVWAIVGIIATVFTFTDHVSVEHGGDGISSALFFTSWSVWLATVVAIVVFVTTLIKFIKGEREGYNTAIPCVKFAANIMIIATFIVGGIVLKQFFDKPGSVFKHFLLPIVTVVDCVLFDQKNKFRIAYPFTGVIIPLLYWIIVLARLAIAEGAGKVTALNVMYYCPYGFTRVGNITGLEYKGWGGLIGMLAGILVGLIIIGFIFWVVDKLHIENKKIVFDSKINEDEMTDEFHFAKNLLTK